MQEELQNPIKKLMFLGKAPQDERILGVNPALGARRHLWPDQLPLLHEQSKYVL